MIISIDEFDGFNVGPVAPNMIITRDDSLQEQKIVDLNLHFKLKERFAYHEQLLMNALKPYFDKGWKLVSTSVETSTSNGDSDEKYYRYYLNKEQ